MKIKSDVSHTTGFTSQVTVKGKVVGHVLLCDFDNSPIQQVFEAIQLIDGLCVVLESSSGHFHLINPVVRPFERTALMKLSINGDDLKHLRYGYLTGRWVLRYGSKLNKENKIIAERPRVYKAYLNAHVGYKRLNYSIPHLRLLKDIYGIMLDVNQVDLINKHQNFFGDDIIIEHYLTVNK